MLFKDDDTVPLGYNKSTKLYLQRLQFKSITEKKFRSEEDREF